MNEWWTAQLDTQHCYRPDWFAPELEPSENSLKLRPVRLSVCATPPYSWAALQRASSTNGSTYLTDLNTSVESEFSPVDLVGIVYFGINVGRCWHTILCLPDASQITSTYISEGFVESETRCRTRQSLSTSHGHINKRSSSTIAHSRDTRPPTSTNHYTYI